MLPTAEKIACAVREFISGNRRASLSRLPVGRLLTSSNFLLPAFSPALFAAAMLLTIIIVDPYGFRPWGVTIHLKDGNYPGSETTRLMRTITSHRQEVVLIGGSPMMPITPSLLREEFGVHEAANLAYEAPTWQDTSIVIDYAVHTPSIRRILIEVDHTQIDDHFPLFATGDTIINFSSNKWYETPDFSFDTARALANNYIFSQYDIAEWGKGSQHIYGGIPVDKQPSLMRQLEIDRVAAKGNLLDQARDQRCADNRFVHDGIIPAARTAAKSGARLDLIFAPIPFETYVAMATDARELWPLSGGRLKPGQIVHFHQCIVREVAAAGLDNVFIHAVDLDGLVVCDLANYRDRVHPVRPAALRRLMDDVATQRYLINSTNVSLYGSTMAALVSNALRNQSYTSRRNNCFSLTKKFGEN
ncbi:MAG TPA: hypothetical protein VLC91_13225, partial [Spongiibacteraceae bacterium]|nr:hypothetical protein [Spongiibacteraceae bacterium]